MRVLVLSVLWCIGLSAAIAGPPSDFYEVLGQALEAAGAGERPQIELAGREAPPALPRQPGRRLDIEDLQFDRQTRAFAASVVGRDNGQEISRQRVSGRAHATQEVPVLRTDLPAGQAIGPQHLQLVRLRVDRMERDSVRGIAELLGQVARRDLAADRPIRASEVQPRVVVAKGSLVTLLVRLPGLELSATGRALEDGAQGQAIAIMNLQSKRTVQGEVVASDLVRVALRANLIADRLPEEKRP